MKFLQYCSYCIPTLLLVESYGDLSIHHSFFLEQTESPKRVTTHPSSGPGQEHSASFRQTWHSLLHSGW